MNEKILGVGEYCVCFEPQYLVCLGLGSCLGISLYVPNKQVGGMAHAMLPNYQSGRDIMKPGKYADTAIYLMIDELTSNGVSKRSIHAKLVGGAQMFNFYKPGLLDVGNRNIEEAKKVLSDEKIRVVAEDVGGNRGRTVRFDMSTGIIMVHKTGGDFLEI